MQTAEWLPCADPSTARLGGALIKVKAKSDDGAPDRIRTCDPWLRKPILYPTELRAREAMIIAPGHACTRAQHCRTRAARYNELLCPRLAPDSAPRELRGHEGTRPALLAHQDAEAADRRRRPRLRGTDRDHRARHATRHRPHEGRARIRRARARSHQGG